MRTMLAVAVVVLFAGAIMVERAAQRSTGVRPATVFPPAPTAAEESGQGDLPLARPTPRARPAAPPPRRQHDVVPPARQPPPPGSTPGAQPRMDPQGSGAGIAADEGNEPGSPRVRIPTDEFTEKHPLTEGRIPTAPVAPVVTPPVLLAAPAVYPVEGYRVTVDRTALIPDARMAAAEGRVVLHIRVLADGSVGTIDVSLSSGTAVLDAAAVQAAQTWRFAPATRDGVPIESWVTIPVRFVVH